MIGKPSTVPRYDDLTSAGTQLAGEIDWCDPSMLAYGLCGGKGGTAGPCPGGAKGATTRRSAGSSDSDQGAWNRGLEKAGFGVRRVPSIHGVPTPKSEGAKPENKPDPEFNKALERAGFGVNEVDQRPGAKTATKGSQGTSAAHLTPEQLDEGSKLADAGRAVSARWDQALRTESDLGSRISEAKSKGRGRKYMDDLQQKHAVAKDRYEKANVERKADEAKWKAFEDKTGTNAIDAWEAKNGKRWPTYKM